MTRPSPRLSLDLVRASCLLAAYLGGGPLAAAPASAGTPTTPAASPASAPCDAFTLELAEMLQAGPFRPPLPQVAGPVAICWRHSDGSRRGAQAVYARFEKMSRESFTDGACKSPVSRVDKVAGIGEAACAFRLGDTGLVSLSVLTKSGWVVQVGNSTLDKCKAVIGKLLPKLPR